MDAMRYETTICPYCTCGCGIYLVLRDGEIAGVEPRKDYRLNEGRMCIKGNNAHKYLSHPDRLKSPLVDGQPVSWQEALELVGRKLGRVSAEDFGVIGSGKTSNEESYLLQKFARAVMHTNNVEYCARFCHSATVAGLGPTVGSGVMQTSQLDLDKADCVIVAGVNLAENFPGIARRIRRAREGGARVIVLDPRVTMTVKSLCDIHLQLKPGTDVAVLNAMARIIVDERLENEAFIESRTSGFEEFRDSLADLDPQGAAETAGVAFPSVREAAVAYAEAARGCILFDVGITQHISGSDNIKLLADLALLTGHIGRPGTGVNPMRGQISGQGSGDMGCVNAFYPGYRKVGPESAELFEKLWGVEGLPPRPGKSYMDIINTCKAVYMVGVNPMISAPDSGRVRAALEKLDFLVVQDIFMTETAELADVVLPAAAWVEREGTHTGIDRRVVKIAKIVEPPGEARADWWIISGLAQAMGQGREFDYASAEDIFEEIRTSVPQYSGITYRRLEQASCGIHWPCLSPDHPGTPTMFTETFNTPDGRGHFIPVAYRPPAELPDGEYPFLMTTGRVIFHYHTASMTKRTDKLAGELSEGFVQMNPADAARLDIHEGQRVTLTSRRGKIEVKARITPDVPGGITFVPFHFAQTGANNLTNTAFDPACKMPEFKVCAIKIEKTENAQ